MKFFNLIMITSSLVAPLVAAPDHAADDHTPSRDYDFDFADSNVHHRDKRPNA